MKNPPRWFTPAVALGSTLLTLYAIEAAFSIASPDIVDRIGVTLRKGPSVVSETWRIRQRGIKAYPYLQSDLFSSDSKPGLRLPGGATVVPLAGIPGVLTVLCNESGTTVGYRSDSLGFRNPPAVWSQASDMVIVGDSFAHGFCRPEPETIAGQLRQRGLAVANVGSTGAGPLAELGIIREYVAAVKPRKVFWLFYEGNDLIDLDWEEKTTLVRYLQPGFSQHLREHSKGIAQSEVQYADSVVGRYEPPGRWIAIEGFLTLRNLRTATGLYRGSTPRGSRNETRELALLRKVLARANGDVRGWGGEMFVVYLPERRRFNSRLMPTVGENHDPNKIELAVSRITTDLGIPMLNAASEFAREPTPARLWNARRYHYNAKGYGVVADLIARSTSVRGVTRN